MFRERAEYLLGEYPLMQRKQVIKQVFDYYDMKDEYKGKFGFGKETIHDYLEKVWNSLVPKKKSDQTPR